MTDTPIPALEGNGVCWSRAQLDGAAALLAATLQARGRWVLATLLDNSPAWVVAAGTDTPPDRPSLAPQTTTASRVEEA